MRGQGAATRVQNRLGMPVEARIYDCPGGTKEVLEEEPVGARAVRAERGRHQALGPSGPMYDSTKMPRRARAHYFPGKVQWRLVG